MDYQIGEGFIRVLDRRYNKSQIFLLEVRNGSLWAENAERQIIVPGAPYDEVEDPDGVAFVSEEAMDQGVVDFFIDAPDSGGGGAIGDGNGFYVEDGNGNAGAKSNYSKGMVTEPLEFIWGNPTEDNQYTSMRLDGGSLTFQVQDIDPSDPENVLSIAGRTLTIDTNRVQMAVFENDETGTLVADSGFYYRADGLQHNVTMANGNTTILNADQYTAQLGMTNATHSYGVGIDSFGRVNMIATPVGGSNTQQIAIGNTDDLSEHTMIVTDDVNGRGLEYKFDYGATFTDRSLVDKAYVDSVAGGGGGGTPDLQDVTTEGSTTSTTITHAAADSTSKSATLGQANTVARAPFLLAEVESLICPGDYALRWPGTADATVNISPTISSSSYGKSIFFFNVSDTFSATLEPTDKAGGGRMWIDGAEDDSIVVGPKQWIRFFHDGVIWVCIGKSF